MVAFKEEFPYLRGDSGQLFESLTRRGTGGDNPGGERRRLSK